MTVRELAPHAVERVWGRETLPSGFARFVGGTAPIGEIWFEDGEDAPLLVKYLFTSQRLSIQVHPDDDAAVSAGHKRGKDEAWLVLDADPGAVIGLGLVRAVDREELRAAAIDGSIEQLIDWRPVAAGDFFYSPAGTVHAIGAGLALVEVQQNLDLTYRLYDYGRPRELHLDDGMAVADPSPWLSSYEPHALSPERTVLAAGGRFVVERWTLRGPVDIETGGAEVVIMPLGRGATLGGLELCEGSVVTCSSNGKIEASTGGADLLVAYDGRAVREELLRTPG